MIVLKNINTAARRLKKGDAVRADDDFSPYSLETLMHEKFVGLEPAVLELAQTAEDALIPTAIAGEDTAVGEVVRGKTPLR